MCSVGSSRTIQGLRAGIEISAPFADINAWFRRTIGMVVLLVTPSPLSNSGLMTDSKKSRKCSGVRIVNSEYNDTYASKFIESNVLAIICLLPSLEIIFWVLPTSVSIIRSEPLRQISGVIIFNL